MKKYFQSTGYILSLFAALYALHAAITYYDEPFNLYENPLVWILLIGIVTMVILKEVVDMIALRKNEEHELEKQGIDPKSIDPYAGFKKLMKRWTKSKDIEEEEEIILDHNYDGIKELDNSLPPWWLYLFYATVIFGVVYLVRFHVVGDYDQETEYQTEVKLALLEIEKNKNAAGTKLVKTVDAATAQILTDESSLNRGKAVFNMNCASCHAKDGGGGIGPNLTDEYWILGGSMEKVFTTISEGGRSGKGMVPWKKTLKSVDIEKVASYVMSMQGTRPKKPKAAQGELWEEE